MEPKQPDGGEQRDVVVVGAGPVGLVLALGLARDGVDVLVLEKEPGTAEHSRAPAIWPGTQEILDRLGVIERFRAEGIEVPVLELWDADRKRALVRLPFEELEGETAHPRLLVLPQSETERLLADELAATESGEVRFSSPVIALDQGGAGDGVTVTYRDDTDRAGDPGAGDERPLRTVRARFVVGCDGARSVVRKAIGGSLEGITYEVRASLADIRLAPGGSGGGDGREPLPAPESYRFPCLTTEPWVVIGIRVDGPVFRLILPYPDEATEEAGGPSLEQRVAAAAESLFPGHPYKTLWKSEFRLHRRLSDRWAAGRVVLAGDAAHLNSPVGGEGMNAGIADADGLRDALRAALEQDRADRRGSVGAGRRGTVDPRWVLDTWALHRRAAIESGVNRFTDRMTRVLLAGEGRLLRPAMALVGLALRNGTVRRKVMRQIAMLERG